MNIALLRVTLTLSEINHLIHEFPQYLFLSFADSDAKNIAPEYWARVEILFGDKLSLEELKMATSLRWIHTPSSHLARLCLTNIENQGNILVTCTPEENAVQTGEFVMGVILAYAKNLFHWKGASSFPALLWDTKWRKSMMTLKNKKLVQVGMDKSGKEIAKKASELGILVTSIDKEKNFHPFCHQNLSIQDLHRELPDADIVSVELPQSPEFQLWFGLEELKLMKEDAILILRAPSQLYSVEASQSITHFEKLRGALFDASYFKPLAPTSPLWTVPNLIITPDVASRPKPMDREAYRLFRTNLRQYAHGNFTDMRNLVDTDVEFT